LISEKQRPVLLAELRQTLSRLVYVDNSCGEFGSNVDDPAKLKAYRLSEKQLLVSIGCWAAAYNRGDGCWVVNARPPYSPVLVTNLGNGYANGQIISWLYGRGSADCMSRESWTWDGRQFVHTSSMTTGMCTPIAPDGAWELPTVIVKMNKAD
jgi:hypothetical protein